MKNKRFIIILTVLISLLSALFLSFGLISGRVERQAEKAATVDGLLDHQHKQQYLDSVWNQPVIEFAGLSFTYKEIKQRELHLGLDLKGGLYLLLEVSPRELVTSLANNPKDPLLGQSLPVSGSDSYLQDFYEKYQSVAHDRPLVDLFITSYNQTELTINSSDQEVLSYLQNEIDQAVDRTLEILNNRINQFGVTQATISQLPGTQRIAVEIAGVDNPERVKNLLKGLAKLEFYRVYEMNELSESFTALNADWLAEAPVPAVETDSSNNQDSLAQLLSLPSSERQPNDLHPLFALNQGVYDLAYQVKDTAAVNRFIEEAEAYFPDDVEFKWAAKPEQNAAGAWVMANYPVQVIRDQALLSGEVIADARQDYDEQGSPAVSMLMNHDGARKWQRITAENIDKRIAIVLDDKVYSAPVVRSEIPNGNSSISGNFSMEEAKDLANILKSGKMPTSVNIVEEAMVGPSLGNASIQQGLISIMAGFMLVVVFMMAWYGKGGNLANLALVINVLFILGILAQLGASLTLPGMAGLVLTMGMAVDANVLIFERIREELRQMKPLAQAIKTGYEKAFSSIFDSNITTFLVGIVLYLFGSGMIKGFATVLMIGIACSMFTAVFVTRVIVEMANRRKMLNERSFHTFISKSVTGTVNFDFLRYRKFAYYISAIVIVVGIGISLLTGSYKPGIDFTGGHSFVVRTAEPLDQEKVRSALQGKLGDNTVEIKTFNDARQLKITSGFVDSDNEEQDQVAQIIEKEMATLDQQAEIIGYSKVGSTLAEDIASSAKVVIIVALALIFFYILLRFNRWQFSMAAIIALIHDVLIIFALYGLANLAGLHLELDQIFVASLLTIIGYSINDTVVVFDRIREVAGKTPDREQLLAAINPAVNRTLSRTIITSVTVLIVVLILLFFAGELLRGFSFSLLVGVIFGTYSSIFIASPIVIDFMTGRLAKSRTMTPKKLKQTA